MTHRLFLTCADEPRANNQPWPPRQILIREVESIHYSDTHRHYFDSANQLIATVPEDLIETSHIVPTEN